VQLTLFKQLASHVVDAWSTTSMTMPSSWLLS